MFFKIDSVSYFNSVITLVRIKERTSKLHIPSIRIRINQCVIDKNQLALQRNVR